MENIIKKVIESEYRAQQIISEVAEERKQAGYNAKQEVRRIREEIFMSLQQELDRIKTEKLEQAKIHADLITSEANEKISRMQSKLSENRDEWVRCLLDSILRR